MKGIKVIWWKQLINSREHTVQPHPKKKIEKGNLKIKQKYIKNNNNSNKTRQKPLSKGRIFPFF